MGETEEEGGVQGAHLPAGYGYSRPPGQGDGYPQPPGRGMGDLVATAALTMAVTPFLQAIATHFGSKLAGAVDDGTRAAVRRFLRRESGQRANGAQPESARPISLRTQHGWHVVIPVEIPAEALAQLQDVEFAVPPQLAPEPIPCIQWIGNAWHVMGAHDGATVLWRWDTAAGRWTR
ncbi:hypothetical protein [Streptomyces sp. CA-132043]|uniref:hypothetical protein n=1 Tax=Streptomyces sp. CA-132043 TaxID=3240048 RepID=UPI003D8A901C